MAKKKIGGKRKCKHCSNTYQTEEIEEKFGIFWWTDEFCCPDCAILSKEAVVMHSINDNIVRFSITLDENIFERVQRDSKASHRSLNGQINFVITNYYVFKDLEENRL